MRNYSIDRVEVAWQGLDFKEGLATGSSITEARANQSFTMTPSGAVPRVTRTYNPDRSGTLTFLVDQASKLHQDLRELAEQDVQTRDIVGAMVIKDISSGEQLTYKNSHIMTQPDEVRATEASVFSWVFNFEDFGKTVSKDVNIVGN